MVGRKFKPLTLTSITSITSPSCYTDAHAKLSKQHKSTIRCINPTLNPDTGDSGSLLFAVICFPVIANKILTLEQKIKCTCPQGGSEFVTAVKMLRGEVKKKNLSRYLTHSVTEHSDLFHFPICGFHLKASTAAVSATCTFLTLSGLN